MDYSIVYILHINIPVQDSVERCYSSGGIMEYQLKGIENSVYKKCISPSFGQSHQVLSTQTTTCETCLPKQKP